MRNIKTYESFIQKKIFEAIYIGKIGLKSYQFVYDSSTTTGQFILSSKSGEDYIIEFKSNGKPNKDGSFNTFRIFSPSNKDFDMKELTEKIVYILNKNRLGYKFKIDSINKPKYGLQPYGLISVDKSIEMVNLEKLVASTKTINNKVKKGGSFDQFTF
jgi:hypothetical protein